MRRTTITLWDNEWKLIRNFCAKNDLKISGFLRKSAVDAIRKATKAKIEGGMP